MEQTFTKTEVLALLKTVYPVIADTVEFIDDGDGHYDRACNFDIKGWFETYLQTAKSHSLLVLENLEREARMHWYDRTTVSNNTYATHVSGVWILCRDKKLTYSKENITDFSPITREQALDIITSYYKKP